MAKRLMFSIGVIMPLLVGCATTSDDGTETPPLSERIDAILAIPLEGAEQPPVDRCLSDAEVRNFKSIGDRHILFEGRRGKYWVNTMRTRCPDLRRGTMLAVRTTGISNRYCDGDRFEVGDWFTSPWYRRWPWRWGVPTTSGSFCVLGKFQAVSESQVDDILFELKQD